MLEGVYDECWRECLSCAGGSALVVPEGELKDCQRECLRSVRKGPEGVFEESQMAFEVPKGVFEECRRESLRSTRTSSITSSS